MAKYIKTEEGYKTINEAHGLIDGQRVPVYHGELYSNINLSTFLLEVGQTTFVNFEDMIRILFPGIGFGDTFTLRVGDVIGIMQVSSGYYAQGVLVSTGNPPYKAYIAVMKPTSLTIDIQRIA